MQRAGRLLEKIMNSARRQDLVALKQIEKGTATRRQDIFFGFRNRAIFGDFLEITGVLGVSLSRPVSSIRKIGDSCHNGWRHLDVNNANFRPAILS